MATNNPLTTTSQSTLTSSNAVDVSSSVPVINQLMTQASQLNTNSLVSNADISGVKANLQFWQNRISSNGTLIISKGDSTQLSTDLQNAKNVIQTYSGNVAKANKTKLLVIGGIIAVIVIGIVVFHRHTN